jgi:hypothetical protein
MGFRTDLTILVPITGSTSEEELIRLWPEIETQLNRLNILDRDGRIVYLSSVRSHRALALGYSHKESTAVASYGYGSGLSLAPGTHHYPTRKSVLVLTPQELLSHLEPRNDI